MKKNFINSLVVLAIFVTAGCVSTQTRARPSAVEYKREATFAISQSEKTSIGDSLKEAVQQNPGQSGFRIFEKGSQSLMARLALVRLAEKTVDLQYYAISNDMTSNLMMEALIHAAERGVRVRLLIDSFTVGDMKEALMAFNGVPNIEIRVFNPMTTNQQSFTSKIQGWFTDLPYANRRMHNKALIADNQMAIMGGRNLSDEYFEADSDLEFKDMDALTAGPITAQISKSFDKYWNDQNTFPVAAVYKPNRDVEATTKLRAKLEANWRKELLNPSRRIQLSSTLPEVLKDPDMALIWAKAELSADDPLKIEKPENGKQSAPLNKMVSLLDHANKEFLVISAYFVPGDNGVEWLGDLVKRGIDVKILTNSLASTDVVAVHSGYAPYRERLLKEGVELYELMPTGDKRPRQRLIGRSQPPRAGLHSKVYVIDGKDTMIGSFNLDPRSVNLNTEMALVIHSPEIAERMERSFARATAPEVSYRLGLDKDNSLVWNGIEKNKKIHYRSEPHSGVWRTIENKIVNMLPVENQL